MNLDSLGALNAFASAAETRSFAAAGRSLGVSSSAVGKAVSRLEERLGVRLFNRSTRVVTLTAEGNFFLEACQRIFAELAHVEGEFAQTQGAPTGKLRVSLPIVGMLMMPTLSRFLQAYPEIELDMDFSDRLVDVINDGFDVVIRTGESDDSRLMSRRLGTYALTLVGAPSYLTRAGIPTSVAELAGHACLHHKYPTSGRIQRFPLIQAPDAPEIILPVKYLCNTIEALVALAETGRGIACVPDFAVRRQVADGSLVVVMAAQTRHEGAFRALWPSSRYLPPRVRAFVDFMAIHLFPARQTMPAA